jgi:UDP-GlcNAc:undecaprenyl-phosphate GlcNAc-1-phosphate transferase
MPSGHIIYEFSFVLIMSFLFVYNLTPLIIKFARKINFVDNPDARKVHKQAMPLLGGLSVFIGFFVFVFMETMGNPIGSQSFATLGYLLGATLIMLVGLFDDKYGMHPAIKLILQVSVCFVFIHTNDLYGLFGSYWVTVPLIVLWMTGLMNAFNFLDNMDGILAGMSGILAIGFYVIVTLTKTPSLVETNNYVGLVSLAFAGAVFGFLPHNFNPAKIFLGDAGSMFFGYFFSTMGILTANIAVESQGNNAYYLLPILLLSFAIFDICLVSFTRKRDGRRISQGGKDHSTHRIGTAMQSTKITALVVYLINTIIMLTTILVLQIKSIELLIVSIVIFFIGFLIFGRKLDQIPIVVPENQLKNKNGNGNGNGNGSS